MRNALLCEVQRCACVPKHLNRTSHVAVTINQALTLKERVPVAFRLVCPDDENLWANTMKRLPQIGLLAVKPCADHSDHQRGLTDLWRGNQQVEGARHNYAFPRPRRWRCVHAFTPHARDANAVDCAFCLGQQDGRGALVNRATNLVGIQPQQL